MLSYSRTGTPTFVFAILALCCVAYVSAQSNAAGVPTPAVYFPLVDEDLSSALPRREYLGESQNLQWADDGFFGTVIDCEQMNQSVVRIPNVRYGEDGPFALALWVRLRINGGESLDYVLSQNGTGSLLNSLGPNVVGLYLPESGHRDHGVVRGIVRDGDDVTEGSDPMFPLYVDSNGCVSSSNFCLEETPNKTVDDGDWHLLALTTHPSGGEGFQLYVDGELVGEVVEGETYVDSEGDEQTATGGSPMNMTGDLYLCSRSDEEATRFYSGSLAHLMIWNEALTAESMMSLYDMYSSQLTLDGSLECITSCENYAGFGMCTTATNQFVRCGLSAVNPTTTTSSPEEDPFTVASESPPQPDPECETSCRLLMNTGEYVCTTADSQVRSCIILQSNVTDFPVSLGRAAAPPVAEAEQPQLIAVTGDACQLPLRYSGANVEGCVSLSNKLVCWPDGQVAGAGSWVECPASAVLAAPQLNATGIDQTAALVFAVPVKERFTTGGVACALPTVYNGDIIDTCVLRPSEGWSCPTVDGIWAPCRLEDPRSEAQQEGGIMVAKRLTQSGDECQLPAVIGGRLWFNCAAVEGLAGGSVIDVCPTAAGEWDACAPETTTPMATTGGEEGFVAFNPKDVLSQRTAKGGLGQLCTVQLDEENEDYNCQEEYVCISLPPLQNASEGTNIFQDIGYCGEIPLPTDSSKEVTEISHGLFAFLEENGMPVPLAFFPLTAENLNAVTVPDYSGRSLGATQLSWIQDDTFGSVPWCHREDEIALSLDTVPYGRGDGAFAVNFWMKRTPEFNADGDTFGYLFNHQQVGRVSGFASNQVSIYVPEKMHPAWGTIRAFVKDSTDEGDLVYVDSDNLIQSELNRTEVGTLPSIDVNDGRWHMITVSTFKEGGGFAVYIDGQNVATLEVGDRALDGDAVPAQGGDELAPNGDIFLCARSDLNPQDPRYFDGSVTQLVLFNEALETEQVEGMYDWYESLMPKNEVSAVMAVTPSSGDPNAGGESSSSGSGSSSGGDDGLSGGAIAGIVIGVLAAVALVGALAYYGLRKNKEKRAGGKFDRFVDNDNQPFGPSVMSDKADAYTIQMSDTGKFADINRQLSHMGSERIPVGDLHGQLSGVSSQLSYPPPNNGTALGRRDTAVSISNEMMMPTDRGMNPFSEP